MCGAEELDAKVTVRLSYDHGIHNAMCMTCCDLFTHSFMICVQSLIYTLNHSIVPLTIQHVSPPRCMQQPVW